MGLLDMLQDRRFWSDVGDNAAQLGRAASNAAATNVTGPVDLASFLLSKIGIPVGPAPVGGTEWARQNGLTTGPQSNQMAQIVGETLGNVAPFIGVAKAPEIAGGLLQMIRNAQAPSAANQAARNQLGAIVYHGSNQPLSRIKESSELTNDIFGGVFASNKRAAQSHGNYLYRLTIPDEKILPLSADVSVQKARKLLANENQSLPDFAVEAILSGKQSAFDMPDELANKLLKKWKMDDLGELSWELQRLRGQLAKNMGYKATELVDEHGLSYLVKPGVSLRPANELARNAARSGMAP